MQARAAILWDRRQPWSVEDIELDEPHDHEVRVRLAAAGLCHSDDHLVTGDLPMALPMIGGHEGAGIVEATGDRVTTLAVGDTVVFSFLPLCGRCPSCAAGRSNLCDVGAQLAEGLQVSDMTSRHHARDVDLRVNCGLGTFATHTVAHENSCVRIDDDLPLELMCLLGCGVPTGWGAAVYRAEVKAGETVVVVGIGGLGSAAVQGARLAGARAIVAIDPVESKHARAKAFGATHAASSLAAAFDLVSEITHGRMADKVIMTIGVGDGALLQPALAVTAKRGRVVIANVHPVTETAAAIPLFEFAMMEKELVGCVYGSANPRLDIPRLIGLYRDGLLDLEGMVTRTYSLDDINEGYRDMHEGRNIRGVVTFDA
jgi:NDMA-dependent alcohol dehydrogenase